MERIQVPFEIKSMNEGDEYFIFEGLASTFGNVDLGDDVVDKGAFLNSLAVRMPKILWQHDTKEPIGMPDSIFETEQGLAVKGRLPREDTFVSGRVIPQMKVGSISSMSIGFTTKDFEIIEGIRHLKEVELFEFSLVTFPMNTMAEVTGFKSFTIEDIEDIKTKKQYNEFLKGLGVFSKQAREYLASRFNQTLSKSDDGSNERLLTEHIKSLTNDLQKRLNK